MAGSGEEPLNRELYRIPGHAGWFSWNEIHPIEQDTLVEFFEGKTLSKTPKIYKEYRDFMINKFRENPRRPVTFTEIRKSLIGDVNCLRRVFNFLEKWGLINDVSVQSEGEVPSTSASTVVINSAPPGIQIYQKPFASLQAANLSSRDNVYQIKPGGQQQASPREEWTQQETLLLLEAVSKHGDNWSRVQQHVGTKSRAQCVKQFIQLPYGDQVFSEDGGSLPEVTPLTSRTHENGTTQPPAKKQKVATPQADAKAKPPSLQQSDAHLLEEIGITPFHDTTNQVLSQIALMAAMVGPRVAAAAAQAALNVIAEEEPAVGQLPILKDPATPAKDSNHKEQIADSNNSEVDAVTGVTKPEGQSEAPDKENTKLSAAQLRAGLATALAAAAVNAKHKADQEEREMEAQMATVIETQLRKLYAKLEHFEELEHLMEKERLQLEQMREQVFIDRIQFMRQQFPGNIPAATQDK